MHAGERASQKRSDALLEAGISQSVAQPSMESKGRFAGNGKFGIEISSVNNLEILKHVLRLAQGYGFKVNRVDECRGGGRLPASELREMAALCSSENVGLVVAVTPRAIYDTGGFAVTPNGKRIGYRLRGIDAVNYAVDDIYRSIELGIRAFIIYDEGLLLLLQDMRKRGRIPEEVIFKLSVHMGCANALSAKLYESMGADSINPVPDLSETMLAEMRSNVRCPLDVFSDTADDAGGYLRTHEVPGFVRVAAPIYIKCGPISQAHQNHLPSHTEIGERMKQAACVMEALHRAGYANDQVGIAERTLGIPKL